MIAVTNIEKIDALFYEKRMQHHCGSKIAAKCQVPSTEKFCERYMKKHKINQFYEKKYDAKSEEFWKSIELTNTATTEDIES